MQLIEVNDIKEIFKNSDISFDEPMSSHTTFRIGGPAKVFYKPSTIEGLKSMIKYCIEKNIDYYIMGNGSNLLVSDKGYDGVVIQLYKNMNKVHVKDTIMKAQAGILLVQLARQAMELGLEGLEFASGIPGTLGGAIYMNAGAYSGEMKNVVEAVTVLTKYGEIKILDKDFITFGYRESSMMDNEEIILESTIKLKRGNKVFIKKLMTELNKKRKDKQPLDLPSGGSTFKRPEGYYAGKLIMDAGLKGYRIGDAMVSDKHCGFVVNIGNATSEEVISLVQHIQITVKEMFNVDLHTEIQKIGF